MFRQFKPDPSSAFYALGLCSAEGEGEGDGGGEAPAKTFTQEDIDRIIAKERRSFEAKLKGSTELAEKAKRAEELEARLAELEEEKALAGKTAAEKERARAEKASQAMATEKARLEAEKVELAAELERARKEHQMTRASNALSTALSSAGVFPGAAEDALASLMSNSEMEWDDNGKLIAITLELDGTRYDDPKKAAAAFLAKKTHFAAGSTGGSGTRLPNGFGGSNKPLHERTPQELLAMAAQERRR